MPRFETVDPTEGDFKILIVDDEPVNLQVLTNQLSLENYAVISATSGPEALAAIDEIQPDLVLLDVMMPGMTGYEVSQRLRQRYSLFELPIVILTAKNQADDLLIGFEAGANDYLTKPISKGELLARVRTLLTLKEAVKARELLSNLRQELNIALQIQQRFLPPPHPDWANLDITCYSIPAEEVGGDFYHYYAFMEEEPQRFSITVGDATGKGISAAMLMAGTVASLQAALPEAASTTELLLRLDNIIGGYTRITNQNSALCHAEITLEPGGINRAATLRVVNAGGITPLIRRTNGKIEWVDALGLPLGTGLKNHFGYVEVVTPLQPGDVVIMTSDGVIEAVNPVVELLGFERFEQIVAAGPTNSAEAMLAYLLAEVQRFTAGTPMQDDVTIVVLRI